MLNSEIKERGLSLVRVKLLVGLQAGLEVLRRERVVPGSERALGGASGLE